MLEHWIWWLWITAYCTAWSMNYVASVFVLCCSDELIKTGAQLVLRRKQLLAELMFIYPVIQVVDSVLLLCTSCSLIFISVIIFVNRTGKLDIIVFVFVMYPYWSVLFILLFVITYAVIILDHCWHNSAIWLKLTTSKQRRRADDILLSHWQRYYTVNAVQVVDNSARILCSIISCIGWEVFA